VKRDCDFALYCERNLVERFFNKVRHYLAIATRWSRLLSCSLRIEGLATRQRHAMTGSAEFSAAEISWDDGAQHYARAAPQIGFYRSSNDTLARMLSQAGEGMAIMDLGCGSSGLMLQKLRAHNPRVIYAVDASAKMLAAIPRELINDRVHLVCCLAEELHQHVSEQIDCVTCNSALLLFAADAAMQSVWKVLAPGGRFVFGMGEWQVKLRDVDDLPKYRVIDAQLRQEGHAPKPQRGAGAAKPTVAQVCAHLEGAGFLIEEIRVADIPVSAEDWLAFYSVPTVARMSLPNLSVADAMGVLERAMKRLQGAPQPPVRWLYGAACKPGKPASAEG
jgi:SAM-dependent methyltransferase